MLKLSRKLVAFRYLSVSICDLMTSVSQLKLKSAELHLETQGLEDRREEAALCSEKGSE